MSNSERSPSRGRVGGLVRGSSLLESHQRSSYDPMFSALQYSNPQAVVARATFVLRPGSLRPVDVDPKITRTLAAGTLSLRSTLMWYVIYCYYCCHWSLTRNPSDLGFMT